MKKNRRLENVKYEFQHNKQAIFAAIYLIIIILISIFVVFVNIDPDAIDVANKLQAPSKAHCKHIGSVSNIYASLISFSALILRMS